MCGRLDPIQLSTSVDVGYTVAVLTVTDADIGLNGEVLFVGIVGDAAAVQYLEVDVAGGVIVTSK